MERVAVDKLTTEMVLARSIYLPDGRILIRKNVGITASIIAKLKELRFSAAYVDTAPNDEKNEPVSDLTRSDVIQSVARLDSAFRSGKGINFLGCKAPLQQMISEITENRNILINLIEIRSLNDSIYSHMVQVCIIAVRVAIQMGYDQSKLFELALGVLFHDIGMTRIASDIINRIGGLTSDEVIQIKKHPKTGYDLILQSQNLPATAGEIAFQHHERFNGDGYPRKLTGFNIHEYARIAAVADVFDAMTSEKPYRHAKTISETLYYLKSQKGAEFDPVVVDALVTAVTGE
ncbi:MAG: HD-GYP domain-containing protein [Firmicutes bacterium]|nr:HD-GYP domain-containing protein [Bacillota bacterium]